VDAVYGTWGYKVLRTPAPRIKTEEPLVNSNGYISGGEKFELGAPASAVLRNPKAVTAQNAGVRQQSHGVFVLGMWGSIVLWAALFA
jgi:hypothetical protein